MFESMAFKDVVYIMGLIGGLCVTWGASNATIKSHSRDIQEIKSEIKPMPERLARMEQKLDDIREAIRQSPNR